MRVGDYRKVLFVLSLAFACMLMSAGMSYGQSDAHKSWRSNSLLVEAKTKTSTDGRTPMTQPQALSPRTFLPLLNAAPQVTIEFAAARDNAENLVNPTTSFSYGIKTLYSDALIEGAKGREYRSEWLIDGEVIAALVRTNTIPFQATVATSDISFMDNSNLDRGTYIRRIYIDGVLYAEASATIR